MRVNYMARLWAAAFLFVFTITGTTEAQAMDAAASNVLTARQQSVVAIAAYTANGGLEPVNTALHEGLDAGLTVNEIKEILVQLYAYAGFPRSLNAIHAFMAVLDERQAKGIVDAMGKEPSPVPADLNRDEYGAKIRAELAGQKTIPPAGGYQLFTPAIDSFLKEHLFADIFARDNLDFQTRELATISALAAMSGTAGQLQFHFGAAMNTGLTKSQLEQFVVVVNDRIGKHEADIAASVLRKVLESR